MSSETEREAAYSFFKAHSDWLADNWSLSSEGWQYRAEFDRHVAAIATHSAEPPLTAWVDQNVKGNSSLLQAMRNHVEAAAEPPRTVKGDGEHTFLVERPDGTYDRKARADLKPDDMMVFDGPDSFADINAAKAELDAEIEAAGGLDAWRAQGTVTGDGEGELPELTRASNEKMRVIWKAIGMWASLRPGDESIRAYKVATALINEYADDRARAAVAQALKGLGADVVPLPTNEDQAVLMALLGTNWLSQHSPHRLTDAGRDTLTVKGAAGLLSDEQIVDIADKIAFDSDWLGSDDDVIAFARAVLAASQP